uniref:Ig-like domain-containing protein n=1 Tax=Nothobranchius furzeri TaxID=105023 RepID=A0A8C6ME73_NOTFU
ITQHYQAVNMFISAKIPKCSGLCFNLYIFYLCYNSPAYPTAHAEPVVASAGQSVILPCSVKISATDDIQTVEWSKKDLKPVVVFLYRDGCETFEMKDRDFEYRTSLLKTGDFSLTLRNLQWQDSGVYICTVYKDGEIIKQKAVNLWVSGEEIKVEKGVESVRLCFKFKKLPDSSEVEWRNMWTNKLVWKFENGQEQPGDQHQDYQGRVEVTKDLLRTGDFSLTLKKPDYRDEGVYTCTVYKDKKELVKQKALHLWVIGESSIFVFCSSLRRQPGKRSNKLTNVCDD